MAKNKEKIKYCLFLKIVVNDNKVFIQIMILKIYKIL